LSPVRSRISTTIAKSNSSNGHERTSWNIAG
jgi:hypothetical protein